MTIDHTSFNLISPPMVQVRTTDFKRKILAGAVAGTFGEPDKYFLGQENRRIWNWGLRRFAFL